MFALLPGVEDEAIIQEMRRLMGKVDEMKKQRLSFFEQFRKQVTDDDITNTLVTRDDGNQEVPAVEGSIVVIFVKA